VRPCARRLDHNKVVFYGIGLFSGITMALFPLSVIKTQQMSSPSAHPGFVGALQVARNIKRRDGVRGFYRGFATVVTGAIPARLLYLPTYEATRTRLRTELTARFGDALPDTLVSTACNGVGGAMGSLASSTVVVPMDVVSSRLMVQYRSSADAAATTSSGATAAAEEAASAARSRAAVPQPGRTPEPMFASGRRGQNGVGDPKQGSGREVHTAARRCVSDAVHARSRVFRLREGTGSLLAGVTRGVSGSSRGGSGAAPAVDLSRVGGIGMTRHILHTEGLRGLYRGLGMSLLTYTPSSAAWWAFYALYQDWNWYMLYRNGADIKEDNRGAIAAVQAASGCMAGLTSGALTTPLDVIKTQLQVAGRCPVTAGFTTWDIVVRLRRREGLRGFWRGSLPRMANAALWGTCMVSAYEFLKRVCAREEALEA
jgi:Mitochondrial carrier protein